MARIGYAKIGRSYNLDPAKATSVGGDIDVLNALTRLAKRFPEHTFVLAGKNSGENPRDFGYPANIENPWTEWRTQLEKFGGEEARDSNLVIEQFRRISGNFHETLDGFIVWAGQHGSANSFIPMIGSDWIIPPGTNVMELTPDETDLVETNLYNDEITRGVGEALATPQFVFVNYCSWLLDLISRWREAGPGPTVREEIWLCPDPRNYLKCRELRWPIRYPVLGQYDFLKYRKAERYGRFPDELARLDPTGFRENSLWVSNVAYCYSALELTAVGAPDQVAFDPRPGPHRFGMVVNENLVGVKDSRKQILEQWIFPNFPNAQVRGHWTEKTQLELQRIFEPVPYPESGAVMKSFATTLTTPASGSEWATAKPWEAFALGSVCFFHPRYDGQGHILPLKDGTGRYSDARSTALAQYLRVDNAAQLVERVNEVLTQPERYHVIVTEQRRHYEKIFAAFEGGILPIADRIESSLYHDNATGWMGSGAVWCERTEPDSAVVKRNAAAPRPRGTNEERKYKAPISRRRKLRGELTREPLVEVGSAVEASMEPGTVIFETPPVAPLTIQVFGAGGVGGVGGVGIKAGPLYGEGGAGGEVTKLGEVKTSTILGFGSVTGKTAVRAPTTRLGKVEYFAEMTKLVAKRSTCLRRQVGTVLVSGRGHVLATGYNGVPSGFAHCNEGHPCEGASSPSGTNLDACLATHSEISALMQCRDVYEIESVFITTAPCVSCVKALLSTGATKIYFIDDYPQAEAARKLWLSRPGNTWTRVGGGDEVAVA